MCCGLIARHQEQGDCAQHFVFAQSLTALLGGDEAAYQVVSGLPAAVRNHPAHVLHQLLVAAPSLF